MKRWERERKRRGKRSGHDKEESEEKKEKEMPKANWNGQEKEEIKKEREDEGERKGEKRERNWGCAKEKEVGHSVDLQSHSQLHRERQKSFSETANSRKGRLFHVCHTH